MARAVVIGLAETGVAVTRTLRAESWDVIVVEDAPATTETYAARAGIVQASGATLVEAPDPKRMRELAGAADLVVPSPLVRPTHTAIAAAEQAGVPVRSEIDLAAERSVVPIIVVTGTNGKTTVTTMAVAMLLAAGVKAVAVGNIGRPLIEAIGDDVELIVAEVSSFQLAFTPTFRPRVAVLLAITPDHLDWHGSFAAYAEAKARVVAHQTGDDLLVYDADDASAAAVATAAPARTVGVSTLPDAVGCYRVVAGALVYPDGRELARLDLMKRAFAHDRTNALAAAAAVLDLGATTESVQKAVAEYATMPHRVALIGEANGVRWYDDSKATNPDATLRAISSFDAVVLLAGGRNKGLDLSVLRTAEGRLRGVVAFGEAGPEIAAAFAGSATPTATVSDMRAAVRAADAMAEPGDVVLLSPACASFDAYAGYAARGDDFAAEVRALTTEERSPR